MSEWPTRRLGDVTSKVGSGATPRGGKRAYKASGIPLIRSMNVRMEGFLEDGLAFIDEDQARKLPIVETGDVLLNITGASIGRVTTAPPNLAGARVNQHVSLIRTTAEVDPSYLRWFFASPSQQKRIESIQKGVTRPALTKRQILAWEIPVPPRSVQAELVAKIEELFSDLDAGVAALERAQANLARYRAAVLKAAVEGKLVSASDGEPVIAPGHSDLRTLPELVDHGVFSDGDWIETKDQDPEGDVRLIQLADIGDGEFVNKSNRFLTRGTAERLKCLLLKERDILVARMPDPLGRACIFPGDPKPCITAVDVCVVRPPCDAVDRRWLMHALNAPQTRAQIAALQKGTTRKRISRKNLGTVVLPMPPLEQQRRLAHEIDTLLSQAAATSTAIHRSLTRARQVRQGVLSAAFAGRLVWNRMDALEVE